ncbi:conserved hypothetical protein, partial [Ricinus communis]
GGMLWEKPQIRFLKPKSMEPVEILEEVEILIKGMEMALTSCPVFPVSLMTDELREISMGMKGKIRLKLEQAKCVVLFDAATAPESMEDFQTNSCGLSKLVPRHKRTASFLLVVLSGTSARDAPISRCLECS